MMPIDLPIWRRWCVQALTRVDLPAPGGPVKPITTACPRWVRIASIRPGAAGENGWSSVTAREIARRSPARMRSTSRSRSARSSLAGVGFGCVMPPQIPARTRARNSRSRSGQPAGFARWCSIFEASGVYGRWLCEWGAGAGWRFPDRPLRRGKRAALSPHWCRACSSRW